jgi:hypothetical protein
VNRSLSERTPGYRWVHQVPASVVLCVEDDEGPVGELFLQVVRGADPGDPRPDDEDVDVLGLGPVAAWLRTVAGSVVVVTGGNLRCA